MNSPAPSVLTLMHDLSSHGLDVVSHQWRTVADSVIFLLYVGQPRGRCKAPKRRRALIDQVAQLSFSLIKSHCSHVRLGVSSYLLRQL